MSDVPSEIHREILLRLPAASLFRFRTVSKSWRRTIDDPSFVRSHTAATNHRSSPNLLIRTRGGTFYSFPLDSLTFSTTAAEEDGQQPLHVTRVKNLTLLRVPRVTSLPAASCNGLILASHFDENKIWAIWNPLTGDSHQIPPPVGFELRLSCAGIGYDPTTDDYKVVRVDRLYPPPRNRTVYQTLVYSLKSNSWKKIKNCPTGNFHKWGQQSVFFNGALHWKVSRTRFVALDMATESYRLLPLPRTRSSPAGIRLDSFGGCLVLSDDYAMWQSWVMRGYGSKRPVWEELFSSEERGVIGGSSGRLWPLAYSEEGGRKFVVQHDNRIMRWDVEKGCVKRVTIDGLSCSVTSQVIPGSLFRLSEAAREVKRKRSTRLRFTATTVDSGRLSSDSDSDY